MKLFYTEKSPYSRLVRAVAWQRSVSLELINPGHPLQNPEALLRVNPLGKIPCLLLEDGQALYDSRAILAYLDRLGEGTALMPQTLAQHGLMALGYGLMDAAVGVVMESLREEPSDSAIQRQLAKIERTLYWIESSHLAMLSPPSPLCAASLCLAVAYAYLTFRLPVLAALIEGARYPQLEQWAQAIADAPCMVATAPQE